MKPGRHLRYPQATARLLYRAVIIKTRGDEKLFKMLTIIDDFADDPSFTRQSKLLHVCHTRGGHNVLSTIRATRKFNTIHTIIRMNPAELDVYRLRNYKDLYTYVEDASAVYGNKTLLTLYNAATEETFGFLYVKTTSKDKEDMFYKRLDHKLVITHETEQSKTKTFDKYQIIKLSNASQGTM